MAAFDALYVRWERRLYGFIRAYLDDAAEAEDVFHETFMTVLRAPADFSRGSFKAWVHQVARNAALNRLRSRRRGDAAGSATPRRCRARSPATAPAALEARETQRALARGGDAAAQVAGRGLSIARVGAVVRRDGRRCWTCRSAP